MRIHLTLLTLAACLAAAPGWSEEAAEPQYKLDAFKIGKLHLGMPASEVVGLPGCVFTKGELVTSEVDTALHQTWSAPRCGLTLGFSTEDKKSPLKLFDMRIEAPSTLKTAKGIGLGSTEAQVRAQYLRDINKEESISQQSIVLGSIYGGVIFELEKNKVKSIFVGAAAE